MICYGTGGGCLISILINRMQNPTEIRRLIRSERRSLSRQKRRENSQAAATHFIRNIDLLRCNRIALYLAADGELDPQPLIQQLRRLNKKIYLPILRPGSTNALWFSEYQKGDRLFTNRFGIAEPDSNYRKPVKTWGLDLIILPLVAFSSNGTRMGMGGGYYDRTLAYQRTHKQWIRPKLVGYAHECQRVNTLLKRAWDIPLHGVITELGYQSFSNTTAVDNKPKYHL